MVNHQINWAMASSSQIAKLPIGKSMMVVQSLNKVSFRCIMEEMMDIYEGRKDEPKRGGLNTVVQYLVMTSTLKSGSGGIP